MERLESLATTIALAFADDPIWQWLFGTETTLTLEQGLPLSRYFVSQMTAPNELHGFRHHEAVALWTAPGNEDAPSSVLNDELALAAFGPGTEIDIDKGPAITAVMHEARPAEPHWYLGIIAVAPGRHGQGFGGRLLQTMHDRCDRLGLPAYLESSNPRNHSLYLRHGYLEQGEISAAGSPPLMCFLRQPRPIGD